jgi:hypothetical protein
MRITRETIQMVPVALRREERSRSPGSARRFATMTFVVVSFLLASSAFAQSYSIDWFTTGGGGGTSTGGVYAVRSMVAEINSGPMSGGSFRTDGGFLAIMFQQPGRPLLLIGGSGTNLFVEWTAAEAGLLLQETDNLTTPVAWTDVSGAPSVSGTTNRLHFTVPPAVAKRFYRLRRP